MHNSGENKWRIPLLLDFVSSQNWLQPTLPQEAFREILNFEMSPASMTYRFVFIIRSLKMRLNLKEKTKSYEWEN